MRSYLDFEKPVAELEAKVEELRALQDEGDAIAIGEEISRIEGKAAAGARGTVRRIDALAEDAGRAPSAAAALSRLHRRR